MRRILSVAIVLLASVLPAAAQTPQDIVRWIYASLSQAGPASGHGLGYLSSPSQRGQYFSRRMVGFYEANDSYGDDLAQACVDFGFSIPGQDFDAAEILRTLQVTSTGDASRVGVTANFYSFGQPTRVIYEFIPEDGYWKIDDIAGAGFRVSEIPCVAKTAGTAPAATSAAGYCYKQDNSTLRLDLTNDGGARLDISSWQANGHSCSAELAGRAVEGGWDFPGDIGCNLQVRVTPQQGLEVRDPDWACKRTMCGQRAVLEGLGFPRSSQIDCARLEGRD